jgi:hypothetical protein
MCPRSSSRIIKFRVNEPMYMFLQDICQTNSGMEMSELMRGILQYFFMQFAMQRWREPLPKLRGEFRNYLRNLKRYEKDNNEKIVEMLKLRTDGKKKPADWNKH